MTIHFFRNQISHLVFGVALNTNCKQFSAAISPPIQKAEYLSAYIQNTQNTLSCAKNDIHASEMVCMAQNEGIWAKYRPTKENHIQAFRIWFIRMEKSNSNEPNVCVCVHLMDISKNFPSVIAVIYTSCNICSSWLHHQFFWSKQPIFLIKTTKVLRPFTKPCEDPSHTNCHISKGKTHL